MMMKVSNCSKFFSSNFWVQEITWSLSKPLVHGESNMPKHRMECLITSEKGDVMYDSRYLWNTVTHNVTGLLSVQVLTLERGCCSVQTPVRSERFGVQPPDVSTMRLSITLPGELWISRGNVPKELESLTGTNSVSWGGIPTQGIFCLRCLERSNRIDFTHFLTNHFLKWALIS